MRVTRTLGVALIALLAIGIGSATASAHTIKVLNLTEGSPNTWLKHGAPFEAFQEEFNGSKFVIIDTSAGDIECRNEEDHNGFLGEILINHQPVQDEASLTSGGFEFGESCKVAGGGSAFVEPVNFPWRLAITPKGKVSITSATTVGFVAEINGGPKCVYENATKVKGTAVPTVAVDVAQPLNLAFSEDRFKLNSSASSDGGGGCGKTAKLSMELQTNVLDAVEEL